MLCEVGAVVGILLFLLGLTMGGLSEYGASRNLIYGGGALSALGGATILLADHGSLPGRPTKRAGMALLAACALSIPTIWALASPVTTSLADSIGCGSVSRPNRQATDPSSSDVTLAASCQKRLSKQRAVTTATAVPPVAALLMALLFLSRREQA